MCGGTTLAHNSQPAGRGLSPRVRGNLVSGVKLNARVRSIPACAGEPARYGRGAEDDRVYPRVCGGTADIIFVCQPAKGLSPRVRGNHPTPTQTPTGTGSIPACAGEPWPSSSTKSKSRVYPRVCGGTIAGGRGGIAADGLSPRVRGNPAGGRPGRGARRSIPACAGEPRHCRRGGRRWPVYPRVCGGTMELLAAAKSDIGLSPRVRGNPNLWRGRRPRWGSIPACAGEPEFVAGAAPPVGVYPRVCGGTWLGQRVNEVAQGLSPRVRGNRRSCSLRSWFRGSIPACAGEPRYLRHPPPIAEVYPRVCGGTLPRNGWALLNPGLSPRVRGNHCGCGASRPLQRSIPACAGEPKSRPVIDQARGVYPRVCGGTELGPNRGLMRFGLSPRVRGNRRPLPGRPAGARSIPACAGEPLLPATSRRTSTVYPRVCGGTS